MEIKITRMKHGYRIIIPDTYVKLFAEAILTEPDIDTGKRGKTGARRGKTPRVSEEQAAQLVEDLKTGKTQWYSALQITGMTACGLDTRLRKLGYRNYGNRHYYKPADTEAGE